MGREQQVLPSIAYSKWRTVGIRVKEDDLFVLNQKLGLNGFKTLNEFVAVKNQQVYSATWTP
jgi:hypothetical protein